LNEIVRKSPSELKDDDALFADFCKLLSENVNFELSMDKTPVDTVRLYLRRITTAAARGDFIRNITTLMREKGADLVVIAKLVTSKSMKDHLQSQRQLTVIQTNT
jgi:hypothetical protein